MGREARLVDFKKGSTVVIKDSPNQGFFYIIVDGRLIIEADRFLDDRHGRFNTGDTFGLVSALTHRPHLSTIYAEIDSKVLCVPVENLGPYLEKERNTALKMLQLYSRELRAWHRSIIGPRADNESGNIHRLPEDAEIYLHENRPRYAAWALDRYVKWAKANPGEAEQRRVEHAEKRLGELSDYLKNPIAKDKHLIAVEAGNPIFLENEPSDYFYVIQQGSVQVSRLRDEQEFIVDILGPGEIFGEMAILEHKPRMGSAIARMDTVLMQLPPKMFLQDVGASVLQKLFQSLAKRIWLASQREQMNNISDFSGKLYYFIGILLLSEGRKMSEKKVTLPFGLQELMGMAGIFRKSEADIPELMKDRNIVIEPANITVYDVAVLIQTITPYDRQIRKYFEIS